MAPQHSAFLFCTPNWRSTGEHGMILTRDTRILSNALGGWAAGVRISGGGNLLAILKDYSLQNVMIRTSGLAFQRPRGEFYAVRRIFAASSEYSGMLLPLVSVSRRRYPKSFSQLKGAFHDTFAQFPGSVPPDSGFRRAGPGNGGAHPGPGSSALTDGGRRLRLTRP